MMNYRRSIFACFMAAMALMGTVLPVYGQVEVKTEAAPQETPGFAIARLVVGTGVEHKEPVGVAESFPASTERVYCFLEATDIIHDTEVSFVWFHGQEELLTCNLLLQQGPRWRTYAFKNLYGQKGEWRVEIRDSDGTNLKEVKFKVE